MSLPDSNRHTPTTQPEQIRIGDNGQLEVQPLTWDGERLYSRETVAEGLRLFPAEPFEQIRGQLPLDASDEAER